MKQILLTITLAVCLFGCGKAPPKKEQAAVVVQKVKGHIWNSVKYRYTNDVVIHEMMMDDLSFTDVKVGDTIYVSH